MEITCTRCHQTVENETCFCPHCGLPQLVFASDGSNGPAQPEVWTDTARDASSVSWRPAVRYAFLLGVPAAMLCSEPSPLSGFSLMWMAVAATWVVILYVRNQQSAWITVGAGARIGLVTGLVAGWLSFAINGGSLFVRRYLMHRGGELDAFWKGIVDRSLQLTTSFAPSDPAQAAAYHPLNQVWLLSPEGRAMMWTSNLVTSSLFLLLFSLLGGALGARMVVRRRRES
jgi:hypothetical protein